MGGKIFVVLLALVPLIPLAFSNAMDGFMRVPPIVSLTAVLVLAAVAALGYLGVFAALRLWLTEDHHAIMVAAAMAALALAGGLTTALIRRHRFWALAWPGRMRPAAFRGRCMRYLAANGWTIAEPANAADDNVEFHATRHATSLHVFCTPVPPTIAFLELAAHEPDALAICGRPLPPALVHEANGRHLRLIHYSELARLEAALAAPIPERTQAAWDLLQPGQPALANPAGAAN